MLCKPNAVNITFNGRNAASILQMRCKITAFF